MTFDNFFLVEVAESFQKEFSLEDIVEIINLTEQAEEEFEPAMRFRQKLTAKMATAKNGTDDGTKMLLDLVDIGFTFGVVAGMNGAYKEMKEELQNTPVHKRVINAVKGRVFGLSKG